MTLDGWAVADTASKELRALDCSAVAELSLDCKELTGLDCSGSRVGLALNELSELECSAESSDEIWLCIDVK
jgi:hypothetical protein